MLLPFLTLLVAYLIWFHQIIEGDNTDKTAMYA